MLTTRGRVACLSGLPAAASARGSSREGLRLEPGGRADEVGDGAGAAVGGPGDHGRDARGVEDGDGGEVVVQVRRRRTRAGPRRCGPGRRAGAAGRGRGPRGRGRRGRCRRRAASGAAGRPGTSTVSARRQVRTRRRAGGPAGSTRTWPSVPSSSTSKPGDVESNGRCSRATSARPSRSSVLLLADRAEERPRRATAPGSAAYASSSLASSSLEAPALVARTTGPAGPRGGGAAASGARRRRRRPAPRAPPRSRTDAGVGERDAAAARARAASRRAGARAAGRPGTAAAGRSPGARRPGRSAAPRRRRRSSAARGSPRRHATVADPIPAGYRRLTEAVLDAAPGPRQASTA